MHISMVGTCSNPSQQKGSLELLSAGVAPESILPMAIRRAWDDRIGEFATAHGHLADVDALCFDE
ncbi:hypothetical protein C8J57DRAFT_1525784 [Mycena rebaudengoi]|nr:hypothetical protein C8J57DRAFT_1525784 [Mycena rebaudengoi]